VYLCNHTINFFFLHGALSVENTVTGTNMMDVISCHNVEQKVCLVSSFKMLIFESEEVYTVSLNMF